MAKPENISSNQVSKNAPIFLTPGAYEWADIDPAFARAISASAASKSITSYLSGGDFGGGSGIPNPKNPDGTEIVTIVDSPIKNPDWKATPLRLAPDLSDIQIYRQDIDYSVTPPRVTVTFRVRNNTGLSVKGLNVLVPKQ
jgi:hypothetical protein